jgi:hypothetical protein
LRCFCRRCGEGWRILDAEFVCYSDGDAPTLIRPLRTGFDDLQNKRNVLSSRRFVKSTPYGLSDLQNKRSHIR